MSKQPSSPPRYRLTFDPSKIGAALWITPEAATAEFRDGRVASRFAEHWVAKLYQVTKSPNTNEPGCDGFISHPLAGTWRVSVKSLTKGGVKFQQSRYVGSGRQCSITQLRESIEDCDFVIVVDVREFPEVRTIPVAQGALVALVNEGELGISGLKPQAFYSKLAGGLPDLLPWEDRDVP